MTMDATEAANLIRNWLASEKLETREVEDKQNFLHLHVRYPPTKAAHLFNVVIPKNRNEKRNALRPTINKIHHHRCTYQPSCSNPNIRRPILCRAC